MNPLKLIAFDEEDLAVVSSHLQDAVLRVADLAYLPSQRRFAVLLNRFNWEKAGEGPDAGFERCRTALRFERVLGAQLKNLRPTSGERVLSLLSVYFEAGEQPSGYVTLIFSGDASIRLQVECIEAELKDLGPSWKVRSRPQHPDGEPSSVGS